MTTSTSSIKVSDIFSDVASRINSSDYYMSSHSIDMVNERRNEIMHQCSESSLAYKILFEAPADKASFSTKQIWVISYELMKNEDYKQNLIERNAAAAELEERQREARRRRRANRAARKAAEQVA